MHATTHAYWVLVTLVAAERLVELWLSQRHRRWALKRGGIEYGAGHYPWMVALHAGLLAAAPLEVWWLERPFRPWSGGVALAVVLAAMALRYWAIAALGPRWNTRVLVVPGQPAVASGPYRFVRHPNYLAVILEGIALPMVHGAWITALAFTALNAVLLAIRIPCEEAALRAHGGYDTQLAGRPRFLPGASGSSSSEAGRS